MDNILASVSVDALEQFQNVCNIRKDIHTYTEYVRERAIKRSYRDNSLSKTDTVRLIKLLTYPPEFEDKVTYSDPEGWLYFIDKLVYDLGFVTYNTEGQYMGYSSYSTSFPDNYIEFKENEYCNFLDLSVNDQEHFIFNKFINTYSYDNNEFINRMVFSRLSRFRYYGCAVGVMPCIEFANARKLILKVISDLKPDLWYSAASLIKYLKVNHPYFLIPQKIKTKDSRNDWTRYQNFREERPDSDTNQQTINESDPDSFERVEGRFVERFLEGIPLLLQYITVAYVKKEDTSVAPSINHLSAFKINDSFLRTMNSHISEPKVTVQPNFEIHVESEFYPAKCLSMLKQFSKIVIEDKVIILKLQKEMVARALTQNDSLDIVSFFKDITEKELPHNIAVELEEWAGHSEIFTLYEDIGILEGNCTLQDIDGYVVEHITQNMKLVKDPEKFFLAIEEKELIPLKIEHAEGTIKTVHNYAHSLFKKKPEKQKSGTKESLMISRSAMITLCFPAKKSLLQFHKYLQEIRCPFEYNEELCTVTYSETNEDLVEKALSQLKNSYRIKLTDTE